MEKDLKSLVFEMAKPGFFAGTDIFKNVYYAIKDFGIIGGSMEGL